MEKLTGGFINQVYRKNGTVLKQFDGEELIGITKLDRFKRERSALSHFEHHPAIVVPRIHSFDVTTLQMEIDFIQGMPLEDIVKRASQEERNRYLLEAGGILRKIHQPVKSSLDPLNLFLKKTEEFVDKADPILKMEELHASQLLDTIAQLIDTTEVKERGVTRLHRDYWLGNILYNNGVTGVIDWELSGVGSPYEDFAIVDLWVTRPYGGNEAFWEGYGGAPNRNTQLAFLLGKCCQFLSTTTEEDYQTQQTTGEGFHVNKTAVIRDILNEVCV